MCRLEGNMYFARLHADVGGTTPDLSLTLTPATTTVAPGGVVTVTATVTNRGPGRASQITLTGFADLTQLTGLVVTPSQAAARVRWPERP